MLGFYAKYLLCGLALFFLIEVKGQSCVPIEYSNELQHRAVLFRNGDIPFSESGKWGMKSKTGTVVLKPIFDSLLNAGPNRVIAVKEGQYSLYGKNYQLELQPMKWINYQNGYFFTINSLNEHITYKEFMSGLRVYNPESEATWYMNQDLDVDFSYHDEKGYSVLYNESSYLDSMYSFTLGQVRSDSKVVLFLKTGEKWSIPYSEFGDFLTDRYYQVYDPQFDKQYVVDISIRDTILTYPNSYLSAFIHSGKTYFSIYDRDDGRLIEIVDSTGKTIIAPSEKLSYQNGFLAKLTNQLGSSNYDFYSFPEMKLITTGRINTWTESGYLLIQDTGSTNYSLYFKGAFVQKFELGERDEINLFSDFYECPYPWAYVKLFHPNGNRGFYAYKGASCELETKPTSWKYQTLEYLKEFDQIVYYSEKKAKGGSAMEYFVYDEKEKKRFVTVDGTNIHDHVDTNVYVRYKDDYMYITDQNGKWLLPTKFDHVQMITIGDKRFLELESNGNTTLVKSTLEVLCDSCCLINNQPQNQNYNKIYHVMVAYIPNEQTYRVYNHSGHVIHDEKYLSLFYSTTGNQLVGLTNEHEVVYIPISSL